MFAPIHTGLIFADKSLRLGIHIDFPGQAAFRVSIRAPQNCAGERTVIEQPAEIRQIFFATPKVATSREAQLQTRTLRVFIGTLYVAAVPA